MTEIDPLLQNKFSISNLFWNSLEIFRENDKHLSDLKGTKYIYSFPWWSSVFDPGVYLIYGGRQVGKTTSVKQYILRNIEENKIKSSDIFYLTCDTILDRSELYDFARRFLLPRANTDKTILLVIDEVTYVSDWFLAIKAIIDEGLTRNVILIITGSDRILLEEGAIGFPGLHRRGKNGIDIKVNPLRFQQYVKLVKPNWVTITEKNYLNFADELDKLFLRYLETGGFLSAINSYDEKTGVPEVVKEVYQNWITADFVRKGKDKKKLFEVLRLLIERIVTPISYSKLSQESNSISTDTIIDYLEHLNRLGVITILHAFNPNTRSAYPKKDKKFHFHDPLIAHVVARALVKQGIYSKFAIEPSLLIEGVVAATCSDKGPVFYFKSKKEIDVVSLSKTSADYIEVKWTNSVRSSDISYLKKHPGSLVLSKQRIFGEVDGVLYKPLIFYLLT